MARAKKTAPSQRSRRHELRAGFTELQKESQGVMAVTWWTPEETIQAIARGDVATMRRYSPLLAQLFDAVEGRHNGLPPLCLTCPAELTVASPPALVGIIHAERPDPQAAIAIALCHQCRPAVVDSETFLHRILPALQRVWPDARGLKITPMAGHA